MNDDNRYRDNVEDDAPNNNNNNNNQNRNLWIVLAVIGIVLALMARKSAGSAPRYRDDAEAEDGTAASSTSSSSSHVATKSLFELENEREILRRNELNPVLDEATTANQRVAALKSQAGWFASSAQKTAISAAEQEAERAAQRLAVVQRKEQALTSLIKPQLGLVSAEYFHEVRGGIKTSFSQVSSFAYNQAIFDSLWNLGRHESLIDLAIDMLSKYSVVFIIGFFFVAPYLILWHLPWTIYSYCDGVTDVPLALFMWLMCSLLVLTPAIALYFGARIAVRYGGNNVRQRHGRLFGANN